ncbi:sulfite exporter TauE/SafE family protein [Aquimarina sp. ERC-38]|uniref:sulfite exporter TauE/SafE family protein n=1 Tax=Aquimarina sp. ERC-38 TaxID=2949996 RepID=UPI002246317B|nr:sulfite exporter TauE/SafE family protein [Aquimarina sp. ERC-38]UZO80107.1 sulfite exporter TauE/SafE family protein [Aquimarina sp. ERC-38]
MNEILVYFLIIAIGFFAGIVNTLAGGGSLLTLPLLIFLGLPPAVANGTNRIGIFIQTATSVAGFKSKGIQPSRFSFYLGIWALIGSLIGARIAVTLDEEIFNKILAVIMVLVVIFMLVKPKTANNKPKTEQTLLKKSIGGILFFLIGIYGGFIQAGVGILILFALSTVHRFSLVQSNAIKAIVVGIYTVAALSIFIYNDQVNYTYGLILAAGNAGGGWIASRWSVNKGDGLVKFFLLVMVIAMAIKLWVDS